MKKLLSVCLMMLSLFLGSVLLTACGEKQEPPIEPPPEITEPEPEEPEEPEVPKEFDIKFYVNDDLYYTITTSGNEILTFPKEPSITDYKFEGWYFDRFYNIQFFENTYENKSLESDTNVYAKLTLIKREIGIEPIFDTFKTEYIIGQEIDLTNSKIKVLSNDNTFETVAVENNMISNFSTEEFGEYDFDITYNDFTCKVHYNVIDDPVLFEDFNFTKMSDTGLVYITKYKGNNTRVVLPSKAKGYDVYGIYPQAFANSQVEEVVLSDSIQYIGENAFYNCLFLEKVFATDSLNIIDNRAFSNCKYLVEFSGAYHITKIGVSAFYGCELLEKFDFTDSLVELGASAFGNTGLTSLYLPDSVRSVGSSCFSECVNLESANVQIISSSMFYSSSKLKNIVLRDGIKRLEYECFKNTAINTLYIPSSVEYIDSIISFDSSNPGKVYFLSTENIPTFKSTTPFSSSYHVSIYSNSSIYSLLYNALSQHYSFYSVSDLKIEDNYVRDGGKLLQYIGSEKEFITPENITEIGENAFCSTPLDKITITENVTKIYSGAFSKCPNLKELYLHDKLEYIGSAILKGSVNIIKLKAPIGLSLGISTVAYYFDALDILATPKSLKILELTDNSTDIQSMQCDVEMLILPENFQEVNTLAFGEHKLKYIICKNPETINIFKEYNLFNGVKYYVVEDNQDLELEFLNENSYYEITSEEDYIKYDEIIYKQQV